MFLWGFVAHMLLPLGQAGIQALPFEDKVLPEIAASAKESGLYLFPWPESSPGKPLPMSQQAQQTAGEMYKTAPHGLDSGRHGVVSGGVRKRRDQAEQKAKDLVLQLRQATKFRPSGR